MISIQHGGVVRRPGSRFIAEIKDSEQARYIKFVYSNVEAYILEFGNLYFRVYANRTQITDMGPVEVVTPFTTATLDDLRYVQIANTLFITHKQGQVRPQIITRSDDVTWTIADMDMRDGPYLDAPGSVDPTITTTLTPSAKTGSITITASAIDGINGGIGFVSTDVGRLIRLTNPASDTFWGWAVITAVTDSTHVDADVKSDFARAGVAAPSQNWRLGAWSDTDGWPVLMSFYQQRALFGGTLSYPNTIDASKSGDFTNFAPSLVDGEIDDDSGMRFTIASSTINVIEWMQEAVRCLGIGGFGKEFTLNRGLDIQILAPTNVKISPESSWGSSDNSRIPALVAGKNIVFLDNSDLKLRQFVYNVQQDSFDGEVLSDLSEHLCRGGIIDMDFQKQPFPVIWMVRNDGKLIGFTYDTQNKVFGWHVQEIAASAAGAAVVESIAVIPETQSEDVYLLVKRTINGQTKRYVEILEQPYRATHDDDGIVTDQEDAYYVDCGITYDGVPTDTISGLDHLEGEIVKVLTDGATHPDRTVSGGEITLDAEYSVVHVGLGYSSILETLPMYPKRIGDVLGKTKTVYGLALRFFETLGGTFGPDTATQEIISYRSMDDVMDSPPALFTGLVSLPFAGPWDKAVEVVVRQDDPLPMTILALEMEALTSER